MTSCWRDLLTQKPKSKMSDSEPDDESVSASSATETSDDDDDVASQDDDLAQIKLAQMRRAVHGRPGLSRVGAKLSGVCMQFNCHFKLYWLSVIAPSFSMICNIDCLVVLRLEDIG